MRIKTIMTACLAVPALSVLCLLSSCSSEELPTTEKPSTGPQTLTLNLKAAGTRAAVYTDPGTTAENAINIVTIGIFGSDNNVKTIQEVTTNATNPSITTSQIVVGDQVLVAVNAKAGTFTGAKTVTDFENKTLAIDDALASSNGSATTVTNNNLPMFGTGTIAAGGTSTAFTASVDVYHMVAKITLKSLSVNFLTTGAYKDATFTPTAIFMSNVPDKLDFYPANTMSSYSTFATVGTLQQGELGTSSNLKSYLGTTTNFGSYTPAHATLSGINTGTTYNFGDITKNILYLYTMPSSDATSTRLVIRGDFDPDGAGSAPAVQVYYPVNINYNSSGSTIPDGSTVAKQVYPNKNYIIDVTIQGKGSSSPTTPIDPQTATANITVQNFTSANQSNVFN